MPDFVPVLVAAVLSLVVLLVAFGGTAFVSPKPPGAQSFSRTIVLGQDSVVMYVEGHANLTSLRGEVSQGLFGNTYKKTDFSISNYKDVSEGFIKLRVWNSNYYGALIVRLNGKDVYVGVPEIGERTINFNTSFLKTENTLEVVPESSGWKMWAPTVYIFDADVSVNYIGRETQTFNFDITKQEITNLDRARLLVFGTRKGNGNLFVKVNGREIYSGFTTIYTDFATDSLKEGSNTLDLSTEMDTVYNISSVQVVLFY